MQALLLKPEHLSRAGLPDVSTRVLQVLMVVDWKHRDFAIEQASTKRDGFLLTLLFGGVDPTLLLFPSDTRDLCALAAYPWLDQKYVVLPARPAPADAYGVVACWSGAFHIGHPFVVHISRSKADFHLLEVFVADV